MTRFTACALRGEKVFAKSRNCCAENTDITCLYCAGVFLYLIHYAHAHLTLCTDVFPMIQIVLNLFITIVLIMVVAIFVLARK